MKIALRTDLGKVRKHNEDSVVIIHSQNNVPLIIVADGMGGHRAGDVASSMAVEFFKEKYEGLNFNFTASETEEWLRSNILELNRSLYVHSLSNLECLGMGTTIVAAIIHEQSLTIAHVGDSRGYVLDKEGFMQITEDHTLVNELVKCGEICPEDAEYHPKRNVLIRAVGTESKILVDVQTIEVDEKDMLLLCTDGLSGKLSRHEMEEVLRSSTSIEEKADQFILRANEAGGEDNITLIIVDFETNSLEGEQ